MSEPSRFKMTLRDLEKSVRVAPEDMVEEVDTEVPADDPRGPDPDPKWFTAGG